MGTRTKVIAAAVLVGGLVGSHWFTYQAGNSYGKSSLQVTIQADTIRKLSERVAANSALADRYRIEAEQAGKHYEQELATVRATAAKSAGKRVPIDKAQFCGPTTITETSQTGTAEPVHPGTGFLPEAFAGDLRELAAYADEITAAYRSLRERAAACFE